MENFKIETCTEGKLCEKTQGECHVKMQNWNDNGCKLRMAKIVTNNWKTRTAKRWFLYTMQGRHGPVNVLTLDIVTSTKALSFCCFTLHCLRYWPMAVMRERTHQVVLPLSETQVHLEGSWARILCSWIWTTPQCLFTPGIIYPSNPLYGPSHFPDSCLLSAEVYLWLYIELLLPGHDLMSGKYERILLSS